eukprot:gene28678-32391_t
MSFLSTDANKNTPAAAKHQVAARRAGVTLRLHLQIDEPDLSAERRAVLQHLVVVADRIKVSQVVRNLVSNALKFSKQGSPVEVCVHWDEHGLPEAKVPGDLGLANIHNGSLTALSEGEDKGAEFRLEIPAVLESRHASSHESPIKAETSPAVGPPTDVASDASSSAEAIEVRVAVATGSVAEEHSTVKVEMSEEKKLSKRESQKDVTLSAVAQNDA